MLGVSLSACEMFTSPDSDPCFAAAITISPDGAEVDVGQTIALGAAVTLSRINNDCRPDKAIVGWRSVDPAIAGVGLQGAQRAEIIGVSAGTARVVATAGADSADTGGTGQRKEDTVFVKVTPVTAASVVLSATQVSVIVGNSVPVSATVRNTRNEDITTRSTITWGVTINPANATVSQSGVITGVAKGQARVTATASAMAGTASATVDVTISDPPNVGVASVTIAGPTSVQAAKTIDLTATVRAADGTILADRPVTWSSDAPTKASVAPKVGAIATGVVSGDKIGKVVITASVEGKATTAEVTVIPGDVARVVVTPSGTSLRVGRSAQLSAQAFDARDNVVSVSPFAWSSSTPTIATVDAAGLVTGVAEGGAAVSAKAGSVSGTATIGVTPLRIAYGVANQPQSASYSATLAYNSATGPIGVTRQATGSYRVRFPNQQAVSGESETFLVTRQGDDNRYCKLASWSSAPPADLLADVVCFAFGGAPADAEFSITLLGDGVLGGRFGFALADQPANASSYVPTNSYNSSPTPTPPPVRITRAAAGQYAVTFAGNAAGPNDAEALYVSAVGSTGSRCNFASTLTNETALVRCYAGVAGTGPTVDSRFAITLLDRGRGGGRVAGYAYVTDPQTGEELETPGTYFLSPSLAYNSNLGTVEATKSSTVGRYEVLFHGLAPGGGAPLSVHVANQDADEAMYCGVVSWAVLGSDVRVTIRCWNTDTGEPEDDEFYLIVLQ